MLTVVDACTVLSSFVVTRVFPMVVLVHQAQHYYTLFTWNKSYWSKRFFFWSSLDWFVNGGKSRPLEWSLLALDLAVHALMASALMEVIYNSRQ